MGFYKINNYLTKTTIKNQTLINLKKQKKPFLFILNILLQKIKKINIVNNKNTAYHKITIHRPIFLPFYLKNSYFKKLKKFK